MQCDSNCDIAPFDDAPFVCVFSFSFISQNVFLFRSSKDADVKILKFHFSSLFICSVCDHDDEIFENILHDQTNRS